MFVSRSSRMSQDSASSVCFREEPELQLGVFDSRRFPSHEANLRPCIAFTFAKVEHTNNTFLDQCCIQTTDAMRQNNNVILQKKKLHISSNYYCFGTTWCVAGSVDPFYRRCRDGIAMQGFTMSKRKLQS